MGCWNGTCFISNIPIRVSDPVVSYLIAYTPYEGRNPGKGYCYSTDAAEPIGLPINAFYNDYGSIENWDDKSLAVKIIEKIFDKSMSDILEAISDDALKINNCDIGMVMSNGVLNSKLMSAYIPMLTNISEKDIFEKVKRDFSEIEKDKTSAYLRLMLASSRTPFKYSEIKTIDYLHDIWKKTQKRNRDKLLKEYANLEIKMAAIELAVMGLRKVWTPPSGTGSQNLWLKQHYAFNTMVQEAIMESLENIEERYEFFLGDD